MATCPNCGNQAGEGAVFCDQCGARMPAPEAAAPEAAPAPAGGSVICPACGAGNVPGEAFCDFCGSPLEAPVPAAEAVPELEPVSGEAELEVEAAAPEAEPPAPAVSEVEPAAEAAAAEPAVAEPAAVAPEEPVAPEAAAAPGAAAEPVPAAEPEVAAELTCPVCNAKVQPDEAFCANCGASLAQPPIPPEPVPEAAPEPVAEAPAEPAAPEPVVEEAPPPAPATPTCPACGEEVEAGDAFCSSCGFELKAAPAPAPEPAVEPPPAPAGPRLVIAASGAEIPLPAGDELLVGREDPISGIYPEVDLTPHGGEDGGVSRRHARIIVDGGSYFVEDLDSTNFTFVNKQKVAPKTRQPVNDGDEIRCGRVAMTLNL